MTIIIDNDTGKILNEAIAKLSSRAQRIERYHAAMDALLDPNNAPQPGGPWCELSVAERIEGMFTAKYGGLTDDEIQFA